MDDGLKNLVTGWKSKVEKLLSTLSTEGLTLNLIRFAPEHGCRACGHGSDGDPYTILFVGRRVPETTTYVYTFAMVCIACLEARTAEEAVVKRMLNVAERSG